MNQQKKKITFSSREEKVHGIFHHEIRKDLPENKLSRRLYMIKVEMEDLSLKPPVWIQLQRKASVCIILYTFLFQSM